MADQVAEAALLLRQRRREEKELRRLMRTQAKPVKVQEREETSEERTAKYKAHRERMDKELRAMVAAAPPPESLGYGVSTNIMYRNKRS